MANLESPTRSFYVAVLCMVIGMICLRQPPVDGFLTLSIAPILLVLGYGILAPISLRPRDQSRWPPAGGGIVRQLISPTAVGAVVVFVTAAVVYCITAWPGPGWWDSGEYLAGSYHLWVAPPPGSFLLQLLGRLFAVLMLVSTPVRSFNILIGLLSAGAIMVVYLTGVRLLRLITKRDSDRTIIIASALGAFTLAFGTSVWGKATFANPYTFSLLIGALLFYLVVCWWETADRSGGGNCLLLAAFLFGLDLSVHRSNLLLIPFFIVVILLRRPAAFRDIRLWLGAIGLFALGLSLQVGIMLRAQLHPVFNHGNPDTLSGLWDYFTMKQFGIAVFGSDLLHRKGPFWSYQFNEMYLRYMGWNFIGLAENGNGIGWSRMYGLPLLTGIIGVGYHVIRERRSALMMLIAFLIASLGAVFYLNVPAGFFREMDRHFMVSYLTLALWIGVGSYALMLAGRRWLGHRTGMVVMVVLLGAVLPANAIYANWSDNDMHGNFTASAYGRNLLETCEPNAILITAGDSDTFLPLYFQAVEQVRPDVTVLNIHLLNTPWYLETLLRYQPDLPWALTADTLDSLRPLPWETDTVALAGLTPEADSIRLIVEPSYGGRYLLVANQLLLDLVRENRWQCPLYFSAGFGVNLPNGLGSLARLDGLAWRICPDETVRGDITVLANNIQNRYDLRGLSESFRDPTGRQMTRMYLHQLAHLAQTYKQQNDSSGLAQVDQVIARSYPQIGTLDSLLIMMGR